MRYDIGRRSDNDNVRQSENASKLKKAISNSAMTRNARPSLSAKVRGAHVEAPRLLREPGLPWRSQRDVNQQIMMIGLWTG